MSISRIDKNQPEIVMALRQAGATVSHLHEIGKGMPDLAVGFRGVNYFFEVKDGSKAPSKQRLTPDEERWHSEWRGQVAIIRNADEALRLIGAL